MRRLLFGVALLACAAPATAQSATRAARPIALRFGTLVDGAGRTVRDAVVVVSGDRIVSVGAGARAIPRGAEVRDLRRYTAIPGLIDAHTHMTYYWDRQPGSSPWQQHGARNSAVSVFLAQENARRTLETGVTTVRDLGSRDFTDVAMRDLIARGAFVGPRMFVSAHGLGKLRPTAANPTPVSNVTRARFTDASLIPAAIKAQVDGGADVIKVYGSTGSAADVTGDQTFTAAEMKVAVDAAHALGKRIAIHSYGPDGGRDAAAAGAESVEHAVDLDDAALADMARRGTVYVPTIDHNRYYAEYRAQFGYTDAQAAAMDAYRERNIATARRAFRAGVPFAMGSDAVFTMFGQNTRELGWFVKIGMSPAQALATATVNGARLLGREKDLGAIAPGYYADIVAVQGNPLADINVVIDRVRWVMKGGVVVVDRR